MASSSSKSEATKTLNFPTPQSLSDWLKFRLPSDSFASWGVKPGTKNVHNLRLELSEGEASLIDSIPPVQTVEVMVVRVIGKGNKVLLESHQELYNGNIRERCQPLSEKMKPGESIEAAVRRAAKEELGSIISGALGSFNDSGDDGIVRIVPHSYTKKEEERVSGSYPGLPEAEAEAEANAKTCACYHKRVGEDGKKMTSLTSFGLIEFFFLFWPETTADWWRRTEIAPKF